MDAEGIGATSNDVDARVAKDFLEDQHREVRQLLGELEDAVPGHSVHRVQVAALMLAGGDWHQLESAVEVAKMDYRDVLAPAFYPDPL